MWSRDNTWRGLRATSWLAALLATASPSAAVQDVGWPDAGDVVAAFQQVREWLDAFSLPAPRDQEAAMAIRDASAVCVLLRRSGRLVGSGAAAGGDDGMLRRAAGRAFGAALSDPSVAALPETLRDGIGVQLSLELEVAGRPIPMLEAGFAQIQRRLDPGLEAIAVRRGERWAVTFPSEARAAGRSPDVGAMIRSLAFQLDLPPADPARLRRDHGAGIYRAATIHLAQAGPDRRPFQTFRGQVLVPASAATIEAIVSTADRLAGHILRSRPQPPPDIVGSASPPRAELGFSGDYDPRDDAYHPFLAPPGEQALLAFALGRYAASPGVDPALGAEARRTAAAALEALANANAPGPSADPTEDLATSAAIVLATEVLAGDRSEAVTAMIGRALARLRGDPGDDRSPHALALAAAALAARLARSDAAAPEDVLRAIRRAWDAAPGTQALGMLPWIVWAELDWAAATGAPPPHRERLLEVRDLLRRCSIGWGVLEGPPDLDGGFALNADDFSGSRATRATAQGLRPAAALATMVGSSALTGEAERDAALGRHLRTIRFLMQLTARPESVWSVRDPLRAEGGIRAAPWDPRQPAAAQAMGLLVLVETLRTLHEPGDR